MRKPEYMVSTMSVTTAAVPGTHPSLRPRVPPPSACRPAPAPQPSGGVCGAPPPPASDSGGGRRARGAHRENAAGISHRPKPSCNASSVSTVPAQGARVVQSRATGDLKPDIVGSSASRSLDRVACTMMRATAGTCGCFFIAARGGRAAPPAAPTRAHPASAPAAAPVLRWRQASAAAAPVGGGGVRPAVVVARRARSDVREKGGSSSAVPTQATGKAVTNRPLARRTGQEPQSSPKRQGHDARPAFNDPRQGFSEVNKSAQALCQPRHRAGLADQTSSREHFAS